MSDARDAIIAHTIPGHVLLWRETFLFLRARLTVAEVSKAQKKAWDQRLKGQSPILVDTGLLRATVYLVHVLLEQETYHVVQEVQPSEFPQLPIAEVVEDESPGEFVHDGVATIALDAIDDDACLMLGQKRVPSDDIGPCGFVRKVHDGNEAHDTQDHSDDTLNGENPLPAVERSNALHLAQSIREDVARARCQQCQKVEGGEALLNFESYIPAR